LRCQSATELKTDLNRLKRDLDSGSKRAAEVSDSRPSVAKQGAKSLAVLYFENLSGAKEDEYLRRRNHRRHYYGAIEDFVD